MATDADERPPVAAGHIRIKVMDVPAATDFFETMGLRRVARRDAFAVLELRGGTHLVVGKADAPVAPGTDAPIDLMVDDVAAMRDYCASQGLTASAITSGTIHSSFHVDGPDGYRVKVTSSHTGGRPV